MTPSEKQALKGKILVLLNMYNERADIIENIEHIQPHKDYDKGYVAGCIDGIRNVLTVLAMDTK
jgi:hypothetical protein